MKNKITFSNMIGAGLVFVSRFVGLPPNVSPIGSFGFFSKSTLLFFLTIFLFDYLKGGFYPGFLFTYLGFSAYLFMGFLAKKSLAKKFMLLPVASFLFYLVSNFGVWYYWYPHTWEGLLMCYMLAVPFYKSTLLGDLVFGWGFLTLQKFSEEFRKRYLSAALE